MVEIRPEALTIWETCMPGYDRLMFPKPELFGTAEGTSPLNWQRFLGRRRDRSMSDDEKAYFQERAEAEIALAQRAHHPGAIRSHYLLAGLYLDLVHGGAVEPEPANA